jgi:ATP sulfurylase
LFLTQWHGNESPQASHTFGQCIALRDREGVVVATTAVETKWMLDLKMEAQLVYGASDPALSIFYTSQIRSISVLPSMPKHGTSASK